MLRFGDVARQVTGLPPTVPGTVVTVGTFDGLHRGHRAVLDSVLEHAASSGLPSVVVTFDPHPARVLRPSAAPGLLSTPAEKRELLAAAGVDYVAVLRFTRELSLYSARDFVELVLRPRYALRELVIGYDHGLGRGREGDVETLQRIGQELEFPVHVVTPVTLGDVPISSTRIREALGRGEVEWATQALGRPYSLTGVVVRGEGRGRRLGFPTANLDVREPEKLVPLEGIYVVRASGRASLGPGLLHLGPRPTFPAAGPAIELHLLNFEGSGERGASGEMYGEVVRVEFLKRLREVRSFASAEELVAQMERDREEARRYFQGAVGLQREGFHIK